MDRRFTLLSSVSNSGVAIMENRCYIKYNYLRREYNITILFDYPVNSDIDIRYSSGDRVTGITIEKGMSNIEWSLSGMIGPVPPGSLQFEIFSLSVERDNIYYYTIIEPDYVLYNGATNIELYNKIAELYTGEDFVTIPDSFTVYVKDFHFPPYTFADILTQVDMWDFPRIELYTSKGHVGNLYPDGTCEIY
jgi:hypothetical protein